MDQNASSNCSNGELKTGDLVLSIPDDDYACLVGTVLAIHKLGTPEHDAEADNPTDNVHVNFDAEYSERRIAEIEGMFRDLYGEPKPFGECPIDDVIMSPDSLLRITGIDNDLLKKILSNRQSAEALCETLQSAFDNRNARGNENDARASVVPAAPKASHERFCGEKPSLLAQLRDAAKAIKERPATIAKTDKAGPEL